MIATLWTTTYFIFVWREETNLQRSTTNQDTSATEGCLEPQGCWRCKYNTQTFVRNNWRNEAIPCLCVEVHIERGILIPYSMAVLNLAVGSNTVLMYWIGDIWAWFFDIIKDNLPIWSIYEYNATIQGIHNKQCPLCIEHLWFYSTLQGINCRPLDWKFKKTLRPSREEPYKSYQQGLLNKVNGPRKENVADITANHDMLPWSVSFSQISTSLANLFQAIFRPHGLH